ncbi:Borealin N terminal-domain-containing protein [Colletotrichum navitas]|uniref:Borealin N terminal-domain-containing protein n=1 Tax=Colletotrichum navitas TaxID=681940 RepID=A0AAD8Q8K3_9PEZI|nr:Borealin N terminal-domain-containing protein [Colletotrichum navitas]KAK1598036.1 Borealin N terminal-domain-containing protein [Colletotrichum navitas]
MASSRTKKRVSDEVDEPPAMSERQAVPTKAGTPLLSSSPSKRQRLGISLEQKQAIIDNLQLEITDRARRLRAQYNQQAQTLRSRIQMRVNRVPRSMLKMTMADLVARAVEQQKRLEAASRPPPVPEKDFAFRTSPYKLAPPARSTKRLSDAMAGGDKENEQILNPKKKHRAAPAPLSSSQILSPTSSNTRSLARERPPSSPSKSSQIARPTSSPTKQHTSARSALSNMVEKAKKTGRAAPSHPLNASTTSSNASAPAPATGTAPPTRTRRANTTTAAKAPSRPGTRTGKRISDSSEDSTGTVVKKTAASASAKRTVMGTIRKGVGAATRKPAAPNSAPASAAGTTRVLRKRG